MTHIRLKYVNSFIDRHGKKLRHYFRRPGQKNAPLPGTPGSTEFMAAYQAALEGTSTAPKQIGEERTLPGTVNAVVAAYLDCSPGSSSPFKSLAAETQRTRRSILENFREAHGGKRIYTIDGRGTRTLLLTRQQLQRIVDQKNDKPFAQRNFLNTLSVMFKWALAQDRIPADPTVGVTRRKTESSGYRTWSEEHIAQYRRTHPLGTKARLYIELLLATGARRGDAVKLGPQHMCDGGITGKRVTFEQSKTKSPVSVPAHPDFLNALSETARSKVEPLTAPKTFLTTNSGRPFKTAASLGNWFRERCNEAGLPNGLSAHGLRKATGRRLAELGCTTHQIAAVLGHATLSEVQRYTEAANRERLAEEAIKKAIEDKT
jgi:integrase